MAGFAEILLWRDLAEILLWRDLAEILLWQDLAEILLWRDLAEILLWQDLADILPPLTYVLARHYRHRFKSGCVALSFKIFSASHP